MLYSYYDLKISIIHQLLLYTMLLLGIKAIKSKLGPFVLSVRKVFDELCNQNTLCVSFTSAAGMYNCMYYMH